MSDILEQLKQKGIRVKLGRIHKDDLVKAANLIVAMAWHRDNWIQRVQQTLEGALGEYTKLRCAKLRPSKDYWSNEVKKLLTGVSNMLLVKTKGFSKAKALQEAIENVTTAEHQVTSAINEYIRMMRDEEDVTPKEIKRFREKLKDQDFTAKLLLEDLLEEYPLDV